MNSIRAKLSMVRMLQNVLTVSKNGKISHSFRGLILGKFIFCCCDFYYFFFFCTLSRLSKFVLSFLRMKQIILPCKNLENDDRTIARVLK